MNSYKSFYPSISSNQPRDRPNGRQVAQEVIAQPATIVGPTLSTRFLDRTRAGSALSRADVTDAGVNNERRVKAAHGA